MYYRSLVIFLLLVNTLRAQSVTILTLQPDSCGKDATIDSRLPTNNYGGYADFMATAWTVNNVPTTLRSLIDFDLSSIPANANIVGAILKLSHHTSPYNNAGHSDMSGPNNAWIERITQPWAEFSVNWNNQPTTTIVNRVSVPASTSNTQNYTIDVTPLIQDIFANPGGSFGMMIKLSNENYYRSLLFASSDDIQPALRPKLIVTFDGLLDNTPAACLNADTVITSTGGDEYGYHLPNVFTPNGDGINDSLNILDVDTALKDLKITIYDRWGRAVHEGTLPWDGNDKGGQPCSDGVYYYYAIGRYYSSYAPRKGCFHLMR